MTSASGASGAGGAAAARPNDSLLAYRFVATPEQPFPVLAFLQAHTGLSFLAWSLFALASVVVVVFCGVGGVQAPVDVAGDEQTDGLHRAGLASAEVIALAELLEAPVEVVDAIEKVRTGNKSGHADVPLETVTIVRAVEIG